MSKILKEEAVSGSRRLTLLVKLDRDSWEETLRPSWVGQRGDSGGRFKVVECGKTKDGRD
jgi:hypothetical protein